MSGSFSIQSPATGNKPVDVRVSTDFLSEVENDTNFQTGSMELSGRDGSVLIFNAGNDDTSNVQITLESDEGTMTFQEPWSTWSGILIPSGTGL